MLRVRTKLICFLTHMFVFLIIQRLPIPKFRSICGLSILLLPSPAENHWVSLLSFRLAASCHGNGGWGQWVFIWEGKRAGGEGGISEKGRGGLGSREASSGCSTCSAWEWQAGRGSTWARKSSKTPSWLMIEPWLPGYRGWVGSGLRFSLSVRAHFASNLA